MPRWKSIEEKFKNNSKDISFAEATTLLEHYGYVQKNKGRTSGSRIIFICDGHCDILIHRPHPHKELKSYVIRDLREIFEQEGFWNE